MPKSLTSLGPLAGALAVVLLWPLVHVLLAVPPTALEMLVVSYVPLVFVLLWMSDDAHRRRCTPCHDFGFLMWYLFPLTLLGYLLWTRGWWGLVVFVGMLAIIYVPWIIADLLAFAAQ